jgi:hypothetical protein
MRKNQELCKKKRVLKQSIYYLNLNMSDKTRYKGNGLGDIRGMDTQKKHKEQSKGKGGKEARFFLWFSCF